MIYAFIEYERRVVHVYFPYSKKALRKRLKSIGIQSPLSQIPIGGNKKIKIELIGMDEMGDALLDVIYAKETLEGLNVLCYQITRFCVLDEMTILDALYRPFYYSKLSSQEIDLVSCQMVKSSQQGYMNMAKQIKQLKNIDIPNLNKLVLQTQTEWFAWFFESQTKWSKKEGFEYINFQVKLIQMFGKC